MSQRVVEESVSDTCIFYTVDNESAFISDAAAKIGLTFYEPCQKNVLNSQNIYLLLHFFFMKHAEFSKQQRNNQSDVLRSLPGVSFI